MYYSLFFDKALFNLMEESFWVASRAERGSQLQNWSLFSAKQGKISEVLPRQAA
jgi:hypothetical protein